MVTKINAIQVKHESGNVKDILDTVKPITNYSALRAYVGNATQIRITDPGIAGFFYLDGTTTSTAEDNGGTIIVGTVDSDTGTAGNQYKRWKRLFDGSVNVKWFGAKGDGVTDDTIEIQATIDAALAGSTIDVFNHAITGALYINKAMTLRAVNGRAVFTQSQWGPPGFIVDAVADVQFAGTFEFEYLGARVYPIPVPTSVDARIQAFYTLFAGSERILAAGIVVRGRADNFKTDDVECYGGFCGITFAGNNTNTLLDSQNVRLGVVSVDTVDWGVLIGGGVADIEIKGIAARNIKCTSPSDPSHALYVGPRATGVLYESINIGFIRLNGVELLAPEANNGDAFSVRSTKSAFIGYVSVLNSRYIGNTRDSANLTIGYLHADLTQSEVNVTSGLIGAISAQTSSSITVLDADVTIRNNVSSTISNVLYQASSSGSLFIRSGKYRMVGSNCGQMIYFGGATLEVGSGVSILYDNPVAATLASEVRFPVYVFDVATELHIDRPRLVGDERLVSFSGGITTTAMDRTLVTLDPNRHSVTFTDVTVYDATLRYRISFAAFARTPSPITAGAIQCVLQGRNTVITNNTSATLLAAFVRGSNNQRYLILAGDSVTGITHGNFAGGFVAKGGVSIAAGSWKAIEAVWLGDRLYEIQRV